MNRTLQLLLFTLPLMFTAYSCASDDAVQNALDFETIGSQTLVNSTVMQDPWEYELKVWDGFTYDNEQMVWRSVKGWTLDDDNVDAEALKVDCKPFLYDLLYINDQAHIIGYRPKEKVFKNKMLS